jgi:uncharacterized protein (UPF0333 family)
MNKNILIKKRRGQAALEFLVTYGWAIMAAMLVIGALTYFGLSNPAKSLPDTCTFSNAFVCKDFLINSTTARITVMNSAGQTIYGTGIDGSINASYTDNSIVQCDVTSFPVASLEPEAELYITCNNPPGYPFDVNEKAKVKVTITYAKSPSGYSQVSLGEVYSTVQR